MIHPKTSNTATNDEKIVPLRRRDDLKARARASKRFLVEVEPGNSTVQQKKPAIFKVELHPVVQDATKIINEHHEYLQSLEQMRDKFTKQAEYFNNC